MNEQVARQPYAERGIRAPALADGLCALGILVPALYVAIANAPNTYDDAFITYRYAFNLASGHGFVYNVGQAYLGTTAPLYGLVLGMLGAVFGPESIPLLSGALSGAALFACGLALYAYAAQHGQRLVGVLAGVFFVTCPLLYATFGGEMLFQAALILWAFVAYRAQHTYTAAALLALAVLTRADGLVAAGVVGLYALISTRRVPWREAALALAIIAPFALAAWLFYGTPLPATLDAKLAQRDSGLWVGFTTGLVEWIRSYTMQGSSYLFPTMPAAPNAIRFIPLVLLGIPALFQFRFWLLPLAWITLYLIAYNLLNVPFYHWYIVPAVIALMLLAASGIAGAIQAIGWLLARFWPRVPQPTVELALAALAVLVLAPGIVAQLADLQRLALQPDHVEDAYAATGHWLDANTPQTASVGYFEIGYLGYYARRTIVDPLALVDPTLAPHVASKDFTFAYERDRPDYIVQNQSIFVEYIGIIADTAWFKQEYREVAQIPVEGRLPLLIYQRSH